MAKIKYVINSNQKNRHILNKLIDSLRENHIVCEDILVVFGGSSHIYIEQREHFYELGVQHNSIDFTALIGVIEHVYSLVDHGFQLPDYWFYLHDTCEVGATFATQLSEGIKNINYNCKPLTHSKSMNIGLYKYIFLLNHKDRILKLRSSNHPSDEEVQHLKRLGIKYEDFIFFMEMGEGSWYPFQHAFVPATSKDRTWVSAPEKIYPESHVLRITEYFEVLDFYKYKANWELKAIYTLDP